MVTYDSDLDHELQRLLPFVRVTSFVPAPRLFASTAVLLFVAVGLVACSSTEPEPGTTDATEFDGTPSEYITAIAECMSERGVPVTATVTADGESVVAAENSGTGSAERLSEVSNLCAAEIGYPPVPTTADEIREVHEHLTAQYQCLIDAGWVADRPPSLQVLSDQAAEQTITYDPFARVPADELSDAQTTCPRDWAKWW